MGYLFYIRLIGFAGGSVLNLFLLALIVGRRRPRAFERVLFFLVLALFLFYSGALLGQNAFIHYAAPPPATLIFAFVMVGAGMAMLPPLLVHAETQYDRTMAAARWPAWMKALVVAFYLPLVFFLPRILPKIVMAPSLEFIWPGSAAGKFYGAWLGAALLVCVALERRALTHASDQPQRRLHRIFIAFFGAAGALMLYAYALGGPRNPAWSAVLGTTVVLSALVPGAVLGYHVLRDNFLQIGLQRNLVYAVSASFLALLYLAAVRRVSGWLEPVLPPEATASVLLFVLVFAFEPLQRQIGRGLQRTMHLQMDRLQRLSAELQQEARSGEIEKLIAFAERHIREEFGLSEVRIVLTAGKSAAALQSSRASTSTVRLPLRKGQEDIGSLEAAAYGAFVSGDTYAALEFLAEQLPATLDLCRLIEEKLILERELAERERLALVGQMAASISHNLRNPLSSMKTVLQVLLENPNLSDEVRRDCGLVVNEIDRLSTKLGQLLRFAKPPVRPAGAPQGIGLGAIAEQIVALLRRDAERREVLLDLARPEEELFVRGSEEAVGDVLSNLVVNALEALECGGRVRVEVAQRAALPENLIESELFGYEKGAFTGAAQQKKGKFEQASGGTLFLDEIGDMNPVTQAKVLRALESRKIERLGGSQTIDVDVRVISATHRDLPAEIAALRFPEDLFFRLRVVTLELPPLRAHKEDIPLLVESFLAQLSARHGRKARLAREALDSLVRYD